MPRDLLGVGLGYPSGENMRLGNLHGGDLLRAERWLSVDLSLPWRHRPPLDLDYGPFVRVDLCRIAVCDALQWIPSDPRLQFEQIDKVVGLATQTVRHRCRLRGDRR